MSRFFKSPFFRRFLKNLRLELTTSWRILTIIFLVVIATVMRFFQFPVIAMIAGIVLLPFIMYYLISSVTLFPVVIVCILALLPPRISLPIALLGFLSMFVL